MWPFSRRESKPEPPKFEMQRQPLHVNLDPNSRQAIERHLSRILTCEDAVIKEDKKELPNQTKITSFKTEIRRRCLQMEITGKVVPVGRRAIEDMLQKIRAGG